MVDALGYRGKFAVIAPSTNTSVQPDFDDMRPPASPTTSRASSSPTTRSPRTRILSA